MLKKIRDLLEKSDNITKSTYLWNSINAMLNAAECPVMTLVLTRSHGIYDAGVFSIAYAVATLMLFVGQYGLRRFRSSDIHEKYSFAEYYGARVISCIVMILASVAYCCYGVIFKDYNLEKFVVILLVNLLKCIQAFTDVAHGRMQQMGRLDVATRSSAVRYVAEMLAFGAAYLVTKSLIIACAVCLGVSLVVALLTSMNAVTDYCELKASYDRVKLKMLFVEGFSLFVSLFLNMYLSNAPKYAIDTYLTEEIQAIYNIVFMPAFVVQLVAHFIFNPILTSYAEVWTRQEYRKFNRLVRRQMLVVLGLAVLGLAVAATIGIPVLSWIFSVDLSPYRTELCIVMLGGGMLAYSVFFNTVITIIRWHQTLIWCYGAAAIAAFVLSGPFVRTAGMRGATVLYAVIMTVLTVLLGIILWVGIRREKRRTELAN